MRAWMIAAGSFVLGGAVVAGLGLRKQPPPAAVPQVQGDDGEFLQKWKARRAAEDAEADEAQRKIQETFDRAAEDRRVYQKGYDAGEEDGEAYGQDARHR